MRLARALRNLLIAMTMLGALVVACDGGDGTPSESSQNASPQGPMSYESVSDEGANPNEELTVVADDRTFAPASLTIDSGSTTTIALQNPSDETHTLTLYLESEPSGVVVADTGEVAAGMTGQAVVLLSSGEHAFRCEIHPDVMRGTISVR